MTDTELHTAPSSPGDGAVALRDDGLEVRLHAVGADGPERLGTRIDHWQSGDRLRPVTVVVPTKVSGLALRRRLARRPGGLVGVRFLVAAQLAEQLAAARLAAEGRTPLTESLRLEYLRGLLRTAEGPLRPVRDHPATLRSVDRALDRLRTATAAGGFDEIADALAAMGGLPAAVADLARRAREVVAAHHYDEHDLALAAASAVGAEPARVAEVGPLLWYRPSRLDPATRVLLDALADVTPVELLLGLTGDLQADTPVLELARRLGAVVDETAPTPPAPTRVTGAIDAEQEVRVVARELAARADAGERIDDVAILYRQEDPYATVAHEILRAAGLPHNGPTERTLGQTVAGRFLQDLLRLDPDDLQRQAFVDWLGLAPLRVDGRPVPVTRWDRIARDAGVVHGRWQWDRRLQGWIDEQRLEAEATGRTALARLADDGEQLRRFALALTDRLEGPEERTWTGWSAWTLAIADDLLGPRTARARWPQEDAEAEVTIRQRIEALAGLDVVRERLGRDVPVTREDLRQAIERELAGTAVRAGSFGTGAYVGPLGSAASLPFTDVHVVGMAEGVLPTRPRQDALLPESVVEHLRRTLPPASAGSRAATHLPLRTEALAAERQALLSVVAGAERVHLLHPLADRRQQRGRLPSPWLLELLGRRAGRTVHVGDLNGATVVEGYDRVVSAHDGLVRAVTPLEAGEWRSRHLVGLDHRIEAMALDPVVVADPVLHRAVTVGRLRAGTTFTPYDGRVGGSSEVDGHLAEVLARGHSASSLASYAVCPRSWFLDRVLRLDAPEDPRDPLTIDHRRRGLVVHRVLERFVDEAPDGTREDLLAIAGEELDHVEQAGFVGLPLLWSFERAHIVGLLTEWWEQDQRHRARHGVAPVAAELPFGLDGEPPLELTLPSGHTLRFRGRIDRLDASDDGRTVVVADYKTGQDRLNPSLRKDLTVRGTHLQLPLYGMVAQQRYPDAVVRTGLWFVNERVPVDKRFEVHAFDDTARADTERVLGIVADGIVRGLFPARPGPERRWPTDTYEHCAYCPFQRVCPTGAERDREWRRAAGASALGEFVALTEGRRSGPDAEPGGDA